MDNNTHATTLQDKFGIDLADFKDSLPGGLADSNTPEDFPLDQLVKGIEVEMEHTDDPKKALEISMDHLTEADDYYDRLADMEEAMKSEGSVREGIGPDWEAEGVDYPAEELPVFDALKMRKLLGKDRMMSRLYTDLLDRNPNMGEDEVLEVLFNTYVLDDFDSRDAYRDAAVRKADDVDDFFAMIEEDRKRDTWVFVDAEGRVYVGQDNVPEGQEVKAYQIIGEKAGEYVVVRDSRGEFALKHQDSAGGLVIVDTLDELAMGNDPKVATAEYVKGDHAWVVPIIDEHDPENAPFGIESLLTPREVTVLVPDQGEGTDGGAYVVGEDGEEYWVLSSWLYDTEEEAAANPISAQNMVATPEESEEPEKSEFKEGAMERNAQSEGPVLEYPVSMFMSPADAAAFERALTKVGLDMPTYILDPKVYYRPADPSVGVMGEDISLEGFRDLEVRWGKEEDEDAYPEWMQNQVIDLVDGILSGDLISQRQWKDMQAQLLADWDEWVEFEAMDYAGSLYSEGAVPSAVDSMGQNLSATDRVIRESDGETGTVLSIDGAGNVVVEFDSDLGEQFVDSTTLKAVNRIVKIDLLDIMDMAQAAGFNTTESHARALVRYFSDQVPGVDLVPAEPGGAESVVDLFDQDLRDRATAIAFRHDTVAKAMTDAKGQLGSKYAEADIEGAVSYAWIQRNVEGAATLRQPSRTGELKPGNVIELPGSVTAWVADTPESVMDAVDQRMYYVGDHVEVVSYDADADEVIIKLPDDLYTLLEGDRLR